MIKVYRMGFGMLEGVGVGGSCFFASSSQASSRLFVPGFSVYSSIPRGKTRGMSGVEHNGVIDSFSFLAYLYRVVQ